MTLEEARNKLIDMHAETCAYYCDGKPMECPNCDFCEEREALMLADYVKLRDVHRWKYIEPFEVNG